nr:hypothetical protein [Tanacetum cinerariifolium]
VATYSVLAEDIATDCCFLALQHTSLPLNNGQAPKDLLDILHRDKLRIECQVCLQLVQAVAATDDSSAIPEHTTVETPMNMSPANKAYFKSKKEAIHLILNGIGDEIYSTVDAYQTAQEMWEAIERFVTIVKQQYKLDEVSYHNLFDILKQYQKEVNELRAERLAMNANPLALVATAQANQDPYYQTSKSHKSYAPSSKPSIPTRTHTTTRYKGKKIAKPITPPSETAFEEDSDPEQAQRDKDMQKNLAHIAKYFKKIYKPTNNNLRTSLNSRNKNVDTTPWYKNDNQSGQFRNQRMMNIAGARENECRKPKRVKDSLYHKEKMLLCKQAEKGVPIQAEQYDWLADTDEEIDEQELEAHYSYMAKIQEVPTADTCTDSEPLKKNDQNDVECDDELVALANLIAYLKLDVDENKKIQKQLKKENTTLAQELKECKTILAETSKTLGESNSVRDSFLVALQNKQTEFEKYKAFNDHMQKNLALISKYFKKIYKPSNNNLKTSSNSRNKNVDTTPRYKNDNQFVQFGNQRTMNVARSRENVGSPVVQQSGIHYFNCKEFGHFAKECRKPKRVKDSVYQKEKMLLCKQAEKGVPLQAEQYDYLEDTDEEIDEQQLEAHYRYMTKIQEVPTADSGTDSEPLEQVQNHTRYNVFANDLQHSEQSESISNTCIVETDDSNVIPDSPDMCDDDIQNDQNDVESDDERVAFANLKLDGSLIVSGIVA